MNQPPDNKQPTIAAAVIVHEGKLLLVRRRISEGTLSWQFPAGAVEPGETPTDAAIRETQEETGLTVIYIACDIISGEATIGDPNELAEYTWATANNLPTLIPHGFAEPVQK